MEEFDKKLFSLINNKKYKKIKPLEININTSGENSVSESDDEHFIQEIDSILKNNIESHNVTKYIPSGKIVEKNGYFHIQEIINNFLNIEEEYEEECMEIIEREHNRENIVKYMKKSWKIIKYLLKILEEKKGSFKLYEGLKFSRLLIIAKIGMKRYIEKLPIIFNKLSSILKNKTEKYMIIIDIILYPFEKLILRCGDYTFCDYVEKDVLYLPLSIYRDKEYIDWYEYFSHYELLFFPLNKVIKNHFIGKYVFPNPKNSWEWYYLYKIDGKKYWRLDPYMETLYIYLSEINNNCINLLKELYTNKYNKNVILKKGKKYNGILYILYRNIKIMSNWKYIFKYMFHFSDQYIYTFNKDDIVDRKIDYLSIKKNYDDITMKDIKNEMDRINFRIFNKI